MPGDVAVKIKISRSHLNRQFKWIKRIFRWGCSQQLVPPSVASAIGTVEGLLDGRTDLRETTPILPISDSIVNQILTHLPEVRQQWSGLNG